MKHTVPITSLGGGPCLARQVQRILALDLHETNAQEIAVQIITAGDGAEGYALAVASQEAIAAFAVRELRATCQGWSHCVVASG